MHPPLRSLLLATTALLAVALPARAQAPDARPQGGAVVAGQARITQTPALTQVEQGSNRAVIEWRGFDIGANHQVDIRQPGAQSWSLQRVTGPDPSAIAGRLTSNGGVAIVNPAGIVFHQGAQVDVAGLIASASDTTNQNFMAGRMVFDGAPRPGARVENRGSITVREQGLAALVGPVAANSGTIRARLGRVAIAGAEAVTLDLAGDGLLSLDVTRQVGTAADGSTALATNSGVIAAEGGHVLLTALAASGLLETLVEAGGSIAAGTITASAPQGGVRVPAGALLDAALPTGGGRVTVGAADGSRIGAPRDLAARATVEPGATLRADATQAGAGGTVIVHSAERTRMSGRVSARGAAGGAGGDVEVSSRGTIRLDGRIEVGRGGRVLVDPEEVRIVETPTDASEIAAAVVNETEGDFTVLAEARIRVLAAVDRSVGPLTLMTSNMLAAPSDGIAIEAPLAVLGDLRLRSAGDITQADGARVAAGTLFAESRGGAVRLEAADNAITGLDGGSAAGRFAIVSASRLAVDGPIGAAAIALTSADAIVLRAPLTAETVHLVALGAEGISQAASGAGIAASRLLVETPLGVVQLDGAGNRVGVLGDSEAAGGFALRTAEALHLGGTLNAAGAAVALRADAGDITQETEVSRLVAGRLDLAAPGGGVRLDSPGNDVARVAGSARDALVLESAAPLTVEGSGLAAARIALGAGGDLAQETDALLVTPLLQARAAGAVLLQDPLNAVGGLGESSAAGLFALGTGGTLRVTGLVEAPEVALTAVGGILQDGGAIRAGLLRATALTGGVALDRPGNVVGALGTSGAATDFALATGGVLAVAGAVDAGGAVTLRADSLMVEAPVRGGGVTLVGATGDVVQAGGTIAAATLRAEAGGTVRLDAVGNAIRAVSGRAGPLFSVDSATALVVGDITAEGVALRAGGAITQAASGGGIVAHLLEAEAGGAVDLAAPNAVAALGAVVAPGGLVLRNTTALELAAALDLPSADLGLGGALTQRGDATLAAGTLRLDVRGDVRLEAAGNALPRLLHAAATGDLLLATGGALALEGAVRAGGVLALTAGSAITQPSGTLEAPVLVARSAGGGVTLEAPGNVVGAAGGGAAGAWRLAGAAPGTLGIAALIAAPEVSLTLAGGLSGAGGALRTEALALDAGGAVLLDGPGHRVAALAGRAGALRLDAGGPLDVTGALASGGELALSADRIGLLAPAQAGGNAMLVALTGDVAQAAAGAGLTVAGGLMAFAAGGVALDGAGNQVTRLAGGAAGGGFALATGGALAVGGTLAGETIVLRAAGQVTLDGAAFVAGRAVLVAAPAGIAAGAPGRLDPLDGARLPVLLLDTRAAGLAAIPDFVLPDVPGLPPGSQPTQLAQFGPAGGGAAGPLAFSVSAGFAPVFLLLDGAPALGALEAGRLGIVGQGGTAFLVGALGGVGGEQAALNASVSGAAGSYRFNNCPMGVAGCGAAPPPPGGGGGGGPGGGDGGLGGPGSGPGAGSGSGSGPGGGPPQAGPSSLPVPPPRVLLVDLQQAPGSDAPITEPGTPPPWSPWPGPSPLAPLLIQEE